MFVQHSKTSTDFFLYFCKKYKSCIFIKLSIRCVVMKKTNFQKCTWSSMYVEIITVKKLACLHGIPIMICKSMKLNRDSAMVKALLWRNPLVSASLAEYLGQHREKQPIKCIFDQGKNFPLKRSKCQASQRSLSQTKRCDKIYQNLYILGWMRKSFKEN